MLPDTFSWNICKTDSVSINDWNNALATAIDGWLSTHATSEMGWKSLIEWTSGYIYPSLTPDDDKQADLAYRLACL